MSSTEVLN